MTTFGIILGVLLIGVVTFVAVKNTIAIVRIIKERKVLKEQSKKDNSDTTNKQ